MMESIVNCPECGEQVQVVMKPVLKSAEVTAMETEVISALDDFIKQLGVEKADYFQGRGICGCGKTIFVSLNVTAGKAGWVK